MTRALYTGHVRISCCIEGCRRTRKRESTDADDVRTICGKHWRMGDLKLRDRHKRAMRRIRRIKRLVQRHAIRARGEARIDRVWERAVWACHGAWESVREDVAIKAALGAEDAPRRRMIA